MIGHNLSGWMGCHPFLHILVRQRFARITGAMGLIILLILD